MQPTKAEERLGTAATLLSLDRCVPYYTLMGLTPSQNHAEKVKESVREAILANRSEFVAKPTVVPDLAAHLRSTFDKRFGPRGAEALLVWIKDGFVHEADDFPFFSNWYMLLSLARHDPLRWSALGLPMAISENARLRFGEARDFTEIKAIEDNLEKLPLSAWDTQMYVLHGFDDDEKRPFLWVLETVRKRRFLNYVQWLGGQLSEVERQRFFSSANLLRTQIPTTQQMPLFVYPFETLA